MGLFTPKYPKSDTPGADVPPPTRKQRRAERLQPPDRGVTADQLRGLAMHQGGRVEKAGNYMLIRVEKPSPFGGTDYSHQRYTKRPDGKWIAG
ncbi:hypothetical protein ACFCWG_24795 [Streptomyces sp. NPDC056390]|uniref:hypothetical protein n=1 Tax=Streptomyces sp. NPDC056390 TaxID=3345806 RepID=UPI0035E2FFE2